LVYFLLCFEQAVAVAAAKCTPRQVISQSGILRALVSHPQFKALYLTQFQVEFCQVALLAGQYRYAHRCLKDQWPRPTQTISVRHVLRYFLLRGMIHMGCNDWKNAIRCFWTVLSVPADIVSALAVAAWKKLVLIQCLHMEDDDYSAAQEFERKQQQQQQQQPFPLVPHSFFSLPKSVPNCLSRFLATAANNAKQVKLQKQLQQQLHVQHPEQQQHQQVQHLDDEGTMVQEEHLLGEQASHQQAQRLQQPQQAPSMGVKVYMDLVRAFVSGDRVDFLATMNHHAALLQADGNFGLVRQCETAMIHRQVYQLSRMYSAIPISNVATKLHMEVDATQALLQQLSLERNMRSGTTATTKSNAIWPNISVEDDGIVVFDFDGSPTVNNNDNNNSEAMSGISTQNEQVQSELENNILQLMKLTQDVEKLDIAIAISPLYHALVRRAQDAKMGGPRGVEEL
jgi:PCI domain